MLMAESSDILATARGGNVINPNPYLFGAKEYLTTAGANLLDFTARTYDPSLPLFQTQDPKAWDYTPFNAYTYCGGDPVNRFDKDGEFWDTVWDLCNVAYDVGCAIKAHIDGNHEKAKEYWVDAAIDTGAALIPFVPAGTSKVVKAVKGADKIVDTSKAVDKATDAAKTVDKASEVVKTSEKATDVSVASKKSIESQRRSAVRAAWKDEKQLVEKTGKGTRDWSAAEKKNFLQRVKLKVTRGII